MEKERILSELKTKVGSTNLSDRSLNDFVDAILPTIKSDADLNDAFWGMSTKILGTMGGQIRYEVSNAVEEFKKSYKPTVVPEVKPVVGGLPKGDGSDEQLTQFEARLKAIADENKSLREKVEAREQQETQSAIRTEVQKAVRAQVKEDVYSEYVFKNIFKGVVFDATKPITELADIYLKQYNEEFTEYKGSGAAPRSGNGSSGGSGGSSYDSIFEMKARQGMFPQKGEK